MKEQKQTELKGSITPRTDKSGSLAKCEMAGCKWQAKYGSKNSAASALQQHHHTAHGGPAPENKPKPKANAKAKQQAPSPFSLRFCPCCGFYLEVVNTAVGMQAK